MPERPNIPDMFGLGPELAFAGPDQSIGEVAAPEQLRKFFDRDTVLAIVAIGVTSLLVLGGCEKEDNYGKMPIRPTYDSSVVVPAVPQP